MHRKMKSHILSTVIVLAMCISTVSVAAPAALAYSDVKSSDLSEAVTVLSELGIINGYSDGTFHPDQTLTRAEFSKLAIYAEGKEDQVSSNAYRSLFNDIPTTHWALGCINLAYSEGLVSGYGNGTFGPDDNVTCGQAVTIALRLLGYTSSDIGAFWPQDYMAKAADLGLLDGVDAGANDALTRGDAALMLYAMILQTNASGQDYINTLVSSTVSSAVLLDNDAEAEDRTTDNLEVYVNGNITYYEQASQLEDSLVGQRGTLLLDKYGDVMGFLTDGTSSKTVAIASTTASKITAQNGNQYAVSGNTTVIYQGEVTTYTSCYYDLATQGSVKLYYNTSGSSISLLIASDAVEENGVVVANCESKIASYFVNQFGISGSYAIYKNGEVADADDLEPFDVAVYDKATASLLVSSDKITGYIESVSPSIDAATSVTILGSTFTVLEAAQSDLATFKIGDKVTLLLSTDGQVAAAISASTLSTKLIGVLDSTSTDADDETTIKMTLLDGNEISGLLLSSSYVAEELVGTLVRVEESMKGELTLYSIKTTTTTSDLNVSAGLLGDVELAPDVKIYDQVGSGYVLGVDLDDIKVDTVDSSEIKYVGTNAAGKVNLIILDDVTGDCYTYGFLNVGTQTSGSGSLQVTNRTVSAEYGTGLASTAYITGLTITDGDLGGVAGAATGKVSAIATLTEANITRSAFDGDDTTKINGVLVPISEDVVVYNASTEAWTTLTAAKAFTNSFTVYYDKTPSTGGQIRVIIAN